ncbi:MAG: trypsin-like peptidase domain-containing protein, partial [Myxococcota bacterium]
GSGGTLFVARTARYDSAVKVLRLVLVIAMSGLLCLPAGWAQAPAPSGSATLLPLPELAERTRPSVVLVEVFDASGEQVSSGSGFFVAPGRVATNHHVIANADSARVKLTDGRELAVSGILAQDSEQDIAVLAIAGGPHPPALTLGDGGTLRQGDEVVVIGSPKGLEGTLSVGIVSALRGEGLALDDDDRAKAWEIQVSAAISPGSSGSPIMTRDGKVVAVAVGIISNGANLGFGVPVRALHEVLGTTGEAATPQPLGQMATGLPGWQQNLILSGAFFLVLALAFRVPRWLENRRS